MGQTIVQALATHAHAVKFENLPEPVIHECKRILLDSIGCAFAGLGFQKAKAAVQYAQVMGAGQDAASVLGCGLKVSIPAAAFANAELINAIDMDVVTFPGHVAPAVLAGAMVMAENQRASGKALIEALALGHDIGNRFGRATDNLRDIKDGVSTMPKVFGYTSPIFGAAAAMGKLRGHNAEQIASALGIAGCISPVNSMMSWIYHAPATTIKYTMKGGLAAEAVSAVYLAEFGHRGDLQVLDDRDYGYARFIGSEKWAPEHLLHNLGSEWRFAAETSYKPYPHCRVFNALHDCVRKIVLEHQLQPTEIDSIQIFVEAFAEKPVWTNQEIADVHDAQFSMCHGIAVAAHGLVPGKGWLDENFIRSDSVMTLMRKVKSAPHPDYVNLLSGNAASRPARVELQARGKVFVEEARFPKGSPSPEPASYMTDSELIDKFLHNAEGVLNKQAALELSQQIFALESVPDWSDLSALMRAETNNQQKQLQETVVA